MSAPFEDRLGFLHKECIEALGPSMAFDLFFGNDDIVFEINERDEALTVEAHTPQGADVLFNAPWETLDDVEKYTSGLTVAYIFPCEKYDVEVNLPNGLKP